MYELWAFPSVRRTGVDAGLHGPEPIGPLVLGLGPNQSPTSRAMQRNGSPRDTMRRDTTRYDAVRCCMMRCDVGSHEMACHDLMLCGLMRCDVHFKHFN